STGCTRQGGLRALRAASARAPARGSSTSAGRPRGNRSCLVRLRHKAVRHGVVPHAALQLLAAPIEARQECPKRDIEDGRRLLAREAVDNREDEGQSEGRVDRAEDGLDVLVL